MISNLAGETNDFLRRGQNIINSHQVSVAVESMTATLFAWAGFDLSVQFGANQLGYDLEVISGKRMLKISVKGSKDCSWRLIQNYKKVYEYAADLRWIYKIWFPDIEGKFA